MVKCDKSKLCSFAPLLEKYFLSYMISQRKMSPQTISSYRDSFTLYLGFISCVYHVKPDDIEMKHFSIDHLNAFAEYLENDRQCSFSTINLRISAIKSFLRYAAIEAPEYTNSIRKALAFPARKTEKPVMTYIKKNEYESMLGTCDGSDIVSVRDKMMLMVLYNTGCRASELINIRIRDITLSMDGTSSIRFMGKGRKERITPIWKTTVSFIKKYIIMQCLSQDDYLIQSRAKAPMTRAGIGQRITVISARAAALSPSLLKKNITPHTFRHSAAMNLLQAGVDISTIAIWLGHESIETTHRYMAADIELKRKAMEKLEETSDDAFNYKPSKSILAFLDTL